MNYKTYAEAKIANPDSEIYCAMISNDGRGIYGKLIDINMVTKSHYLCNPADHCSSLKEFLEAGYSFSIGDLFLGTDGAVHDIGEIYPQTNQCEDSDNKRYILSVSALNGGSKIPPKAEQWTIYNNTLPLCELTDEQYGKMRRMHDAGATIQSLNEDGYGFQDCALPTWISNGVYRVKTKSERELFIDKSLSLMTSETERTMEQMFGAQFDAGARYKDLTQHFGENI